MGPPVSEAPLIGLPPSRQPSQLGKYLDYCVYSCIFVGNDNQTKVVEYDTCMMWWPIILFEVRCLKTGIPPPISYKMIRPQLTYATHRMAMVVLAHLGLHVSCKEDASHFISSAHSVWVLYLGCVREFFSSFFQALEILPLSFSLMNSTVAAAARNLPQYLFDVHGVRLCKLPNENACLFHSFRSALNNLCVSLAHIAGVSIQYSIWILFSFSLSSSLLFLTFNFFKRHHHTSGRG